MTQLRSTRLMLRTWREEDLAPFAALNADARVMQHLPGTLDRAASDALPADIQANLNGNGLGLWAVEVPGVAPFIGFVGVTEPDFDTPLQPNVEIGWRLAFAHWGKGYAAEAARAVVAHAFGPLGMDELVSFTVPANRRSRAVMERLGMTHAPADDFDYPKLPDGHPLRRHVLYRLRRA